MYLAFPAPAYKECGSVSMRGLQKATTCRTPWRGRSAAISKTRLRFAIGAKGAGNQDLHGGCMSCTKYMFRGKG